MALVAVAAQLAAAVAAGAPGTSSAVLASAAAVTALAARRTEIGIETSPDVGWMLSQTRSTTAGYARLSTTGRRNGGPLRGWLGRGDVKMPELTVCPAQLREVAAAVSELADSAEAGL